MTVDDVKQLVKAIELKSGSNYLLHIRQEMPLMQQTALEAWLRAHGVKATVFAIDAEIGMYEIVEAPKE